MRKDKKITGFKPMKNRFWLLGDVNQVSGTDCNCVNFKVSKELQIRGYRAWLCLRKNAAGCFGLYILWWASRPKLRITSFLRSLYRQSAKSNYEIFFKNWEGGIEWLL